MSLDNDDGGRGALRDRLPDHPAPAQLEQRVRRSLESRGLIQTRRGSPLVRLAGFAVAAALHFSAGLFAGSRRTPPDLEASVKPKYALILYGGIEGDEGAEHDRRAREYGAWARTLSGDAKWVGGEELNRAIAVYPSPASAAEDPVVGFFLIDATSEEIAKRIARDCPHLRYGGRVVVHPVAG